MKILTATLWNTPDEPLTCAIPESDIEDIENYKARVMPMGVPVTFRSFEVISLDSIPKKLATFMERDRNLAIMYHHNAMMLACVNPHGTLAPTLRAPFSVEEAEPVLKQLCQHPHYRHQTIYAIGKDGRSIAVKDGEKVAAVQKMAEA